MELRHLRYFVAVAETCHFGRAAQRLHIAQPALSQAVRQLEAEVGTALLIRTTRQARLTPAGEFMQREALRILEAVDSTVAGVRLIAEGKLGVVRLALTGTAATSQLPHIARIISEQLPGIVLDIQADLLTPAQCDGLRDGTIDLGVLRPPLVGDGLTSSAIAVDRLVLALPSDHPLSQQRSISMGDLSLEPFIGYDTPDSAVNHATTLSCEAAGFAPNRVQSGPDTAVVLALVSAGLGIALVPSSVQEGATPGLIFRDVLESGSVQMAVAWRADERSPVLRSVIGALGKAGLFNLERVEIGR